MRTAGDMVARAWQRVLDRTSLRADLPFNQAGGDSVGLLNLVFLIEQQFGQPLSLDLFHGDMRPSQMTRALQALRDRGAAVPSGGPMLFLFPGGGGGDPRLSRLLAGCAHLVQGVTIDYPDWRDLMRAPEYGFADLLAEMVAAITARRPPTPVLLAGYSFGGSVAFAVAEILAQQGVAVGLLALVDSDVPPDGRPGPALIRNTRLRELRELLAACWCGKGAKVLAYTIARRLIGPRWRPALRLFARLPRGWLPGRLAVHLDGALQFMHLGPLLRHWRHSGRSRPPLAATTVLFRTDDHAPGTPHDLGWCAHCADLTVVPLPGTHDTMLDAPDFTALSAALNAAVAQALAAPERRAVRRAHAQA